MARSATTKVNIYRSNPALYKGVTAVGLLGIALALNFYGSHPTFTPYGINKYAIGTVFLVSGLSKILFLNVWRQLKWIRISLVFSMGLKIAWALANTQQWFQGKASLQLPITFLALAVWDSLLAITPPVDAYSKRAD